MKRPWPCRAAGGDRGVDDPLTEGPRPEPPAADETAAAPGAGLEAAGGPAGGKSEAVPFLQPSAPASAPGAGTGSPIRQDSLAWSACPRCGAMMIRA
jgi:hypothetical protein